MTNFQAGLENNGEMLLNKNVVQRFREKVVEEAIVYKKHIKYTLVAVFTILYSIYFGYCLSLDFSDNIGLFVLTCIVLILIFYIKSGYIIWRKLSLKLEYIFTRIPESWKKYGTWLLVTLILMALVVFIIVDGYRDPIKFVSLSGLLAFTLISVIASDNVGAISPRTAISGFFLQFSFGVIILRWKEGKEAVKFLGDKIIDFLKNADAGAEFVFGEKFRDHEFVFAIMPPVIFFGACIELLYYLGILQFCIKGFGNVMIRIMKVSPAEAFVTAANIFLGPILSYLTISSFLEKLTKSEIFSTMTSGFATVTGSLFAAYISFGISPTHLVAASIMSAPASLVISKLLVPDKRDKITYQLEFSPSRAKGILDAIAIGAANCIPVTAAIVTNVIAFTSILAFLNSVIHWLGERIGIETSFELIFAYIFSPIPLLLGIEPQYILTHWEGQLRIIN
ncbi:DgyrCDS8683 [Dimorphilus gyrociliatus]|uniref:DgyrCDS8683 n=1 Tax=Dimorphilus gyrociliatus TaxID=2664684 RepID=A0A7I8VUX9_9ANNE|nr:DgyrCDS8683 [Dimorphilus gyrociliatus]